jgi:hypothetical protein
MSNFHFSMKRISYNYNKKPVPSIKLNNLPKADKTHFQFSLNQESGNCNYCPNNNIKDIKIGNVDTNTLENELINTGKIKMLQSSSNNKSLQNQQSCANCYLDNIIGFRIKNNIDDDNFILDCNPNYYLNILEDYHFENITILDKNNNYIILNENMISNNSKKKIIINLENDFYNNLRMPLVLTATCVINNNKILNINGFIL